MLFRRARLWIVLLCALVVPLVIVPSLPAQDSQSAYARVQPDESLLVVSFPEATLTAGELTSAVITVRNESGEMWQPTLLSASIELVDDDSHVIAAGQAADPVQMVPVLPGTLVDFVIYLALPDDTPPFLSYRASVAYDAVPFVQTGSPDQIAVLSPTETTSPDSLPLPDSGPNLDSPLAPGTGQKVDLVFAMDTSGSMDDEFTALCSTINSVVQEMQARGITLNYRILGISRTRSCSSATVSSVVPGGLVNHEEDWGPATSDLSNGYAWEPGSVKLIVPISDEGPQDGNSCYDPGSDRDAITLAIADARRANTRVSPIMGTGANACTIRLGQDLADGTGGRLFYSSNPDQDIADGLIQLVGGAVNRSFITVSPTDVSTGSPATVTVTIRDQNNQLAPGRQVRVLSSRGGLDTISPAQGTTNAQGQFTTTITSQTSGVSILSASDLTANEPVIGTARVTFGSVTNPPRIAPQIVSLEGESMLEGLYAQGFGHIYNEITATVDWSGGPPGTVKFILNDQVLATKNATGPTVRHSIDFGSLRIGQNILRVVAGNSVGEAVETRVFRGYNLPSWATNSISSSAQIEPNYIKFEIVVPGQPLWSGGRFDFLFPGRQSGMQAQVGGQIRFPIRGGTWEFTVLARGTPVPGNASKEFLQEFTFLGYTIENIEGRIILGGHVDQNGVSIADAEIGFQASFPEIEIWKAPVTVVLTALPPQGPVIYNALNAIPPVRKQIEKVAKLVLGLTPEIDGSVILLSESQLTFGGAVGLDSKLDLSLVILNGGAKVYGGLGIDTEIASTLAYGPCFEAVGEGHIGYKVNLLLWEKKNEYVHEIARGYLGDCGTLAVLSPQITTTLISSQPWHIPRGDFGPGYTTLIGATPAMFNELNLTGPDAISAALSDSLLFSNVYANAKPSLAWAPDGSAGMIVWTHDDPAKPTGQGLEVVSSYFDGAGWSTLTKVTNDTYPDTGARVTRLGDGRFLAVWERVNDPALSPSAPFDATSWSKTEIMGAIFNPTTRSWSSPLPLQSANTVLDYEPQLAANGSGAAMAIWRHNAGNELVGTAAHPDELRYARFDGSTWTAGTVATGLVNMGQTSVAYNASDATVAWSQTITPTGVITGTDQIFTSTFDGTNWSSPSQVTSGEPGHGSAQAFYTPTGTPAVAWIQDGQIAWRTLPSGPVQVTNIAQNAHEFQFTTNTGGDMVATWSESDDIYISLYDWAENLWSAPANLTNDMDREAYLGPVFEDTGMLRIGYADTAITEEERSATTATGEVVTYTARIEGQTNLNLLTLAPYSNLTIGEMTVTPNSGGTTADVVVDVANTGYFAAYPVALHVYDGDPNASGVLVDSQTLAAPLAAGITETITITHNIDPTAGVRTFWAVVDPANVISEADEVDNAASLRALGPDLTIESALALYPADSMVDFETVIVNAGTATSGPATIAYYRDSTAGAPIATGNVPALAPGEQTTVLTPWDAAGLAAGPYQIVAIVNRAEASFDELEQANNEFALTLDIAADLVVDPLYFESEPGTNRSVRMSATIFNFSRVSATNVPVVFYQTTSTGLVPVASTSIASIPAGGSATASAVWSAPPSEFSLTAIVDPEDRLNESRRDNNAASLIPGFQMTSDPKEIVLSAGQSATVTINVSSVAGFSDVVSLEALDLPVGATVTINPTTVTPPGTATLQINIPETTEPLVYPVRLVGTSGNLSATAIVSLDVRDPSQPLRAAVFLPISTSPVVVNTPPTSASLANGNFERGPNGAWTEYSSNGWPLILEQSAFPGDILARSGTWAVWEGGDVDEISLIEQDVTIPTATPYLTYWHWIASEDYCGYDFGGVLIDGVVVNVYELCADTTTSGWVRHVVDLRSYAGQTVTVEIRTETDGSLNSNLFIDDVALAGSVAALAQPAAGDAPDWTPPIHAKRTRLTASGHRPVSLERILSSGQSGRQRHPNKPARR